MTNETSRSDRWGTPPGGTVASVQPTPEQPLVPALIDALERALFWLPESVQRSEISVVLDRAYAHQQRVRDAVPTPGLGTQPPVVATPYDELSAKDG